MGRALQVVTGRATNPAALAALTVDTGDSFTVRDFPDGASTRIVQAWVQEATVGILRIRSARFHDAAQAMRFRVPVSGRPLMPPGVVQPLMANDPLTVEVQGGGAETDLASYLVYYDDLPGVAARLSMPEEILPRVANIVGLENTITSGATLGDYGGTRAINAVFDILKADTDYALLGYLTDLSVGTVGITGTDTGNLRVAGPGVAFPEDTSSWFVDLSRATNLPCIPTINSNNRGSTNLDIAHTAAAVAVNVTLILGELR